MENYLKFRPDYPRAILELLQTKCGLCPGSVVADIGCGTGLSSQMFLEMGGEVFGVEPNRDMREGGQKLLAGFSNFRSVDGTAEATGLTEAAVDFIVAGQAFHWFDRSRARNEFARILKPRGWVVLLWNDRRTDSTPFLKSYEALLQKFATDYNEVNHRRIDDEVIGTFFGKNNFQKAAFENQQYFDWEGLKGRLLSSSYAPDHGKKSEQMLRELRRIFELYQESEKVIFDYDTVIYFGGLNG